jgi:hypothetical protein
MLKILFHSFGLLVVTTSSATSDPVTAVVSALAAYGATTTITGFVLYFTAMLALSEVAKSLAPDIGDIGVDGGYDVSGVDPQAHQQIIYGRTRVGGAIVFKETTQNEKYLHIVVALAGHECEALEEIWLDDERIIFDAPLVDGVQRTSSFSYPSGSTPFSVSSNPLNPLGSFDLGLTLAVEGLVKATFHNGASDQVADSTLIKPEDEDVDNPVGGVAQWTTNHRLRGIAYVYLRLEHDPEYFTSGEPRLTFVVKGKKVYDPESQTTAWSDNPALCLRDYLTSDYGLNCDDSEIDDVNFMQAKGACDYGVPQYDYTFSTEVTNADPTSGKIRANSVSLNETTAFYIDDVDAGGTDRQSAFNGITASSTMVVTPSNDKSLIARYTVTSVSEQTGYWVINVSSLYSVWQNGVMYYDPYGGSPLTFENNQAVDVVFNVTGGLANAAYSTNGAFTTDATPENIINSMATSAAGNVFYSLGKFQFYAGVSRTATVTLTDDDCLSGLKVQTKRSQRELFNEVHGLYKGWETHWQKSDYPPVVSQLALEQDGNIPSVNNIDLLFTNTKSMARRVAKVLLLRGRQQAQIQGVFGLKAANLAVGDWITFQNTRLEIDDTFEVVAWSLAPNSESGISFNLTLQEVSPVIYSWSGSEEPEQINPPLVNVVAIGDEGEVVPSSRFVSDVTVAATATDEIINEHVITVINATVAAADNTMLDGCIVEYKPENIKNSLGQIVATTDDDYEVIGQGGLGKYQVRDVPTEALSETILQRYNFRARGVNTVGTRGAYGYATVTTTPSVEPPDDVTDFTANVLDGYTDLEWEPVGNFDLSYYQIRHATETTGAKFSNATTGVAKVSRPASTVAVPARKGTYMIRAYDKLGIPSQNSTSVVITQDMLPSFANTLTQQEHTSFSGLPKTNTTVNSNRLEILDSSNPPSEGSYVFSNYIDTTTARTVRASMHCALIRAGDGGQWDEVGGGTALLDSLAGLWDSLTDGNDNDDVNVEFFISTTTDNPASTSPAPVWSDYQRFKSGDFYGRAFRFMVKLKSTGNGITPSIGELVAKVEYN